MNLNNIIKLFESIGITMIIDENNKITFYDSETKEKMETFFINNTARDPGAFLSSDDKDYDVSLNKLMQGKKIKTSSKSNSLLFKVTHPIIDGERTDNIIINEMEFVKVKNGIVEDKCYIKYDEDRVSNYISISTTNSNKDVYETLLFSDGNVRLEKNGNIGWFNETFDENYYLSKDDMIDVLNNTNLLSEVSDYYSKLFPNIKNSIDKAKQSRKL